MKEWWGKLSLRTRLAGAFALLAATALVLLLAIIARTLGVESLSQGKILPAAFFALAVFFVGGWWVSGWCLTTISELGARINERPPRPLPAELQGLAALLRREAQKRDDLLQELRRFTADASHELRTPITAMRTVGEVVLHDESADTKRLREAIGSMLEEVQRMNGLVERLLRLARIESEGLPSKPRRVSLRTHLLAWRDGVAILAEERQLVLSVECPSQLVVITDVELLGLAVVNLLHNAIQHSPEQAKVSVVARELPDEIEIAVVDQGPGIGKEHHERLFERFYRIDGSRRADHGGFGLGLCIAKTAMERLGGRIGVDSSLRQGATFRLSLPKDGSGIHLTASSG